MTPIDPVVIIQKLLAILKRRFDLLFIPGLVLIPGGYFVYKKLPRKYKATTKIVIEESAHSNPFLGKYAIATRLKKRILLLTNIVTSHRVLGRIVEREAKAKGEKLDRLQKHYRILGLRRQVKIMYLGQGLVQMEFSCLKPKKCLQNLNFIFQEFMKETLRPQKNAVLRSSRFLAQQIKRLKANLQTTENKLVKYKENHSLELPKTFKINLSNHMYMKKQLTKAQIDLVDAKRRRDFLHKKLRYLDPVLDKLKERRLKLRIALARAKARYTNRHPKLKRLKYRLKRVNRSIQRHTPKKARSIQEIERAMQGERYASSIYKESTTNTLRPGRISPFEMLQKTMLRIAVLQKRINKYNEKIKFFTARLSSYPKRELKLDVLKREASVSKELYIKLRTLYEESLVRRELELFDSSRRVLIVEPPILPIFPVSPKAPIVLGGAFVASMMLSVLLIAIAELSDQSIKSTEELHETFEVEVIGNVGTLPIIHNMLQTSSDSEQQSKPS